MELTAEEVQTLKAALLEVLTGNMEPIEEWEFPIRLFTTKSDAWALLDRLSWCER